MRGGWHKAIGGVSEAMPLQKNQTMEGRDSGRNNREKSKIIC